MLVIRLARGGMKKRPFYYITVADKARARDGKYVERIGFYNPGACGGELPIRINKARLDYWRAVGARATDRVNKLFTKEEVILDAGVKSHTERLQDLRLETLARLGNKRTSKAQEYSSVQRKKERSKKRRNRPPDHKRAQPMADVKVSSKATVKEQES